MPIIRNVVMLGVKKSPFPRADTAQLKATNLSWPQSPQRTRRKPWGLMPAFEKGVELVFSELWQVGSGPRLGLLKEVGGVQVHMAVQPRAC